MCATLGGRIDRQPTSVLAEADSCATQASAEPSAHFLVRWVLSRRQVVCFEAYSFESNQYCTNVLGQ